MVNKNLIESLESENEDKIDLGVYFSFLSRMNQCFEALCQCVEGCGKAKAITIISEAFQSAIGNARIDIIETLKFLYERRSLDGEKG